LHRVSGQDDFLVGVPIANRNRAETEGAIGCFVNTLPLRAELAGRPTFRELVARVRASALDAYEHQDLPFEKIVDALQPERRPSQNPLYDLLFNYVHAGADAIEIPGLDRRSFPSPPPQSKLAATLYVFDRDDGITLSLVYRRAQFSAERMRVLLDQLVHLLDQVARAPDSPIDALSLIDPASAPRLPDPAAPIVERDYPLVGDRFLAVAAEAPERSAIRRGERTISYGELAARASALGRTLVAHGLARGDVVAVTGPRSAGVITAMIGALVGGGVLLTIDPELPAARKR